MKKVFGSKNDKDLKLLRPLVLKINELEASMQAMDDETLKGQTDKFRERINQGETLDQLLPEAFATLREASKRVLGMRPFDVQLLGGIVLHQGKISEMKTGEGKTLTATLPLYLNGLSGKGCHLVTVNDYLAQRDADEMGALFNWLGLSVGCIVNDMDDEDRQKAYACDITYGTNNELAFDYLRDNMKFDLKHYVQREHNFCIVDEVDSILIDEARTPLLISGPSEGSTELYQKAAAIIPRLEKETHYTVDEKSRTAIFNEAGMEKLQELVGVDNLYEVKHMEMLHALGQCLKAFTLFTKDVDYVVREERVIIVDEFTGRLKEGSRWSDGLHQAVEAKEKVKVRKENQTLASITFQNFFRLYSKLAGMTGTAETEAEEFAKIYSLDVVVIPTNLPMIRDDRPDSIYKNRQAKFKAVAQLIKELNEKQRPVLVGTISIETSELLSSLLRKEGVAHEVLNAKQHEREASIIANAGGPGAVTIATNMAGRGTDIKLTAETKEKGGLCIIGTERHESRRIDNQLRGRSGRQGDPGLSKFFLSLEDDLMRIFGSQKISGIMNRLGMEEDEPIEHNMITNAIANAQKKVENHNFDIRKHLLDYDNVMNEQRKVIYKIRKDILSDEGNLELIDEMIEDVCGELVHTYMGDNKDTTGLNWEEMNKGFNNTFHTQVNLTQDECREKYHGALHQYFTEVAKEKLKEKFSKYPQEVVTGASREILLSVFDQHWKDHLLNMDHMKEGINLQAYAQRDPLNEYKRASFGLFENMKEEIKKSVIEHIFSVQLYTQEEIEELKRQQQALLEQQLKAHQEESKRREAEAQRQQNKQAKSIAIEKKAGRNDPCPCGSGKKFKHCHGK